MLEPGDDDAGATDDEVARGNGRCDWYELNWEVEAVGTKDEVIGLIAEVAEEQFIPEAHRIDVEVRKRAVLDYGGVVAVEDDDVVGAKGWLHGSGLSGGDADSHEALPVSRTDRLAANRVQEEFERRRGQRNVVLKARQMGMSTWIAGRLFLKTITIPGTMSVQVAHTQDAAESIFRTVHRFLECLPASLRQGALRTGRANARHICFPALDSEFRVESAGDGNVGRGLTIMNLHCSEVSRWPGDAAETLYGLKAALAPQGELILESTPNGAEGCFWTEWMQAESTGTVRHFFPWWWEASYVAAAVAVKTLDDEERRLVEEQGLSLEQIGYRRQLRAGFRKLAKQEYAEDAESCFSASGSCLFDVGVIDVRLALVREPVEQRQNGTLRVWFPAVVGRRYAVAIDPAGGGSEGDYSVAQVIELKTGLQCAELQTRMPVLELAQAAAALAAEYNDAWLVVERNNHGSGVLAYLKSVCRATRIYAQHGQDGWLTSSLSRPGMIAGLGAALVEQPELFQSERLLRECRGFVRLRNGASGAQSGMHDDCVMAMAIALAVRSELV